jgi:hypothetical protein
MKSATYCYRFNVISYLCPKKINNIKLLKLRIIVNGNITFSVAILGDKSPIGLHLWVIRVGVNCSKFDCSTVICSTLLAANQLLDTNFINCSNPVNPGYTGFEQMTKKISTARQCRAVDTHFFCDSKIKKFKFFHIEMVNNFICRTC